MTVNGPVRPERMAASFSSAGLVKAGVFVSDAVDVQSAAATDA
jgi:hypothetical protein